MKYNERECISSSKKNETRNRFQAANNQRCSSGVSLIDVRSTDRQDEHGRLKIPRHHTDEQACYRCAGEYIQTVYKYCKDTQQMLQWKELLRWLQQSGTWNTDIHACGLFRWTHDGNTVTWQWRNLFFFSCNFTTSESSSMFFCLYSQRFSSHIKDTFFHQTRTDPRD